MRAYINVWGNKYPVVSMRWYQGENAIQHVSFRDENDVHYTVFSDRVPFSPNVEEVKGKGYETPHAELEKIITWEES